MARDLSEKASEPRPVGRGRADLRIEDLPGEIRREGAAAHQRPDAVGGNETSAGSDLAADRGRSPELQLSPEDIHGASMAASDFIARETLDEVVPATHGAYGADAEAAPAAGRFDRPARAGSSSLALRVSAAVAVAATVLLAVFDLYLAERLKDARSNAAQLQRQLASVEHRLGRLELEREQQVVPRLDDKGNAVTPEGNPASAPAPPPPAAEPKGLSPAEADIVRDYIKTPPGLAAKGSTLKVGMSQANQPLIPLPPQLVEKLPKLAGGRFRVDRDGSVAIVPGGSDRIGYIIPSR